MSKSSIIKAHAAATGQPVIDVPPPKACRLTLVIDYDTPSDLVEAVERVKDAAREYGTIVSCVGYVTPGDVDFGT